MIHTHHKRVQLLQLERRLLHELKAVHNIVRHAGNLHEYEHTLLYEFHEMAALVRQMRQVIAPPHPEPMATSVTIVLGKVVPKPSTPSKGGCMPLAPNELNNSGRMPYKLEFRGASPDGGVTPGPILPVEAIAVAIMDSDPGAPSGVTVSLVPDPVTGLAYISGGTVPADTRMSFRFQVDADARIGDGLSPISGSTELVAVPDDVPAPPPPPPPPAEATTVTIVLGPVEQKPGVPTR